MQRGLPKQQQQQHGGGTQGIWVCSEKSCRQNTSTTLGEDQRTAPPPSRITHPALAPTHYNPPARDMMFWSTTEVFRLSTASPSMGRKPSTRARCFWPGRNCRGAG